MEVPAGWAARNVELLAPKNGNPNVFELGNRVSQRLGASVSAYIDHPDQVELLVLGPHSAQARVGWEESCGTYHPHPGGTSAYVGANASTSARPPAVIHIALPTWRHGEDRCYFSAIAASTRPKLVRLEAINY